MSDICGAIEQRDSGTWVCTQPADHGSVTVPADAPPRLAHYFVKRKEAICPDCREGKHGNCLGDALDEQVDQIVECFCYTAFHPGEGSR